MRNILWTLVLAIFLVLFVNLACGCTAGSTSIILTYDQIETAAVEIEKGLDAFHTDSVAQTAKSKAAMLKSLGESAFILAKKEGQTDDDARVLSGKIVAAMTVHLANYETQERRREETYRITKDNIAYVMSLCEEGRKFILFRMNIDTQIKQYLSNQMSTRLKNVRD